MHYNRPGYNLTSCLSIVVLRLLSFGQVAQVMRLELARLKKCFGAVSIKTGRWGEVAEGEALAKAKAMDDKIKT